MSTQFSNKRSLFYSIYESFWIISTGRTPPCSNPAVPERLACNNLCNGKTTSIQFDILQKICTSLDRNVNDVIEHGKIISPIEFINKSDTSK